MLKLYYLPGACSTVPHVALVWSGLPFTAEAVSRDWIKSSEYLALNPQGQVPVLVEDGWALAQNVAILDYINDLAPDAQIFGSADTHAKAQSRQWLAFANSDIHPSFGLLFHPQSASDDELVQKDIKSRAAEKIAALFGKVDTRLTAQQEQNQGFLAGTNISIADVYVYVTLRWAHASGIDLSRFTQLSAFYQRVGANAGVQTVLKAQGLQP
ncbi:glutathione S-transferase family protein [Snodgrassella sp. CFCC 13594]|uniref:glutathione S-transferase family protein n=1 Tax=Snodgrassella sp. CFCC 13594 TaxID=1775559 RepID=UPI00082FD20B|nr:glutathione binding-like protein [Snodgrassella sp. CFCC 13594]